MNQATNHPALLVELLTEELPPHALTRLADSFAQGIRTRLATRQLLTNEDAHPDIYATPRRLAVRSRSRGRRWPWAWMPRASPPWP